MRSSIARIAICPLVFVTAMASSGSAAAADLPGATFVEEALDSRAAVGAASLHIPFAIINGSPQPQVLTISLTGQSASFPRALILDPSVPEGVSQTPAGTSASPNASESPGPALTRLITIPAIASGDPRSLVLELIQPAEGSHKASLLLTSSDGTNDRVTIQVDIVPATELDPKKALPNVLQSPLPATIPFAAQVLPMSIKPLPFDPAYLKSIRITPLYGGHGEVVAIQRDDVAGTVTVKDLPNTAGKYTAQIAGADGKSISTLELSVKHSPLLPALVLAIGLLMSYLLGFIPSALARRRLENQLLGIEKAARDAITTEEAAILGIERWAGRDRKVPEIIWDDPEAGSAGALVTAIDRAEKRIEAADPTKRTDVIAAELEALRRLQDAASNAFDLGREGNEQYWTLNDTMPASLRPELERGGLRGEASRLLAGRRIDNLPELERVVSSRESLVKNLNEAVETLEEVDRLVEAGASSMQAEVVRRAVALVPDLSDDAFVAVKAALAVLRDPKAPATSPKPVEPKSGVDLERVVRAAMDEDFVLKARFQADHNEDEDTAPAPRRRRRSLLPYTALLVFLIVVSALVGGSVLYFNNATFGSGGDYAALFTAGVAVATVKLILELVPFNRFQQ